LTSQNKKRDLTAFLLYVIGFFLLWEWIRPLEQLTDTSNVWVFLMFIMASFLLEFIHVPIAVSGSIKTVLILFALNLLYMNGGFFQFGWISPFIGEFQANLSVLIERDWQHLSNFFRSLLFFVLLWLMTYLIQYWLIVRRKIFIFFFMTLAYITVLDTFTPYKADWAIIRTVVLGFIIMGLLNFYRLIEKEGIERDISLLRKWVTPVALFLAASVGIGLAVPKAAPIWPDPVPYIKSYSLDNEDRASKVQKIGYGVDDSQLGGPFVGDNQLVLKAEVESRQYWKVETKDVYTGKGWITSSSREDRTAFDSEGQVPIFSFSEGEGVEKEEETSFISSFIEYSHIVYPLGIKEIHVPLQGAVSFEIEKSTEKIRTVEDGYPTSVFHYSVVQDVPRYSVTALMNAGPNGQMTMEKELFDRYTQLPAGIPERVRELAAEITKDKNTWYEKAKELEYYFKRAGFAYDQKNVAIPGAEDDYVDQFLFETKRGYCDNFSTSMVVLARSLGIPARWVKGYNQGEYKGVGESGRNVFEITNNNAHSWVEIYFPGIGWVPFEPTLGYSSNVQINYDDEGQSAVQSEIPEETQKEEPAETATEEKDVKEQNSSNSFIALIQSARGFFQNQWKWMTISAAGVLILVLAGYFLRGRWLPYYFTWRFKWTSKDENFPTAYMILLKELDRYGLNRQNGQTLRDYAQYVDSYFKSSEMSQLTSRYERLIYKGDLKQGSWAEMKELWENLIKKTIA
jgi:transglutaminase-like putative cysteine protease